MSNVRYATVRRNAMMDDVRTALAGGSIKIYDGTMPANANASLSGNTLLGTLGLASPAGSASSSGTFTFGTITSDTDADATGSASFARLFQSDGTTVVCDCEVGTSGSGAPIILNTLSITIHGTISMSSGTLSIPAT
jgi:hypothetical protein